MQGMAAGDSPRCPLEVLLRALAAWLAALLLLPFITPLFPCSLSPFLPLFKVCLSVNAQLLLAAVLAGPTVPAKLQQRQVSSKKCYSQGFGNPELCTGSGRRERKSLGTTLGSQSPSEQLEDSRGTLSGFVFFFNC